MPCGWDSSIPVGRADEFPANDAFFRTPRQRGFRRQTSVSPPIDCFSLLLPRGALESSLTRPSVRVAYRKMSPPDEQSSLTFTSSSADRCVFFPRSGQQYVAGNVSKSTLVFILLPLSYLSLLSTLFIATLYFPKPYDWGRDVISHLISPRYNPDGFLISSLGMAAAALLALPFAGYLERRLKGIAPRLSRWVGVGLGIGIILVASVTLPFNIPAMPKSVRWVHEALARSAGICVIIGMVSCFVCGIRDRFYGQKKLSRALVASWSLVTLLPIVSALLLGGLKLSRKAGIGWADQLRMYLNQTMFWRLAFWEWFGVIAFLLFMLITAMLLPERPDPS